MTARRYCRRQPHSPTRSLESAAVEVQRRLAAIERQLIEHSGVANPLEVLRQLAAIERQRLIELRPDPGWDIDNW